MENLSESQQLLLIVVAIYLVECVRWARRGSVVFSRPLLRSWRWSFPGRWFGNRDGGITLSPALPPFRGTPRGQSWPLSFSAEGVSSDTRDRIDPEGGPLRSHRFVSFDAITSSAAAGDTILINGEPFTKTGSPYLARRLQRLIETLRAHTAEDRPAAILEQLKFSHDDDRIKQRWTQFEQETRPAQIVTTLYFIFGFIAAPLLTSRFGLVQTWPWLLAGIVLFGGLSIVTYVVAHRALYPQDSDKAERWNRVFVMALMPTSCVRCVEALSQEVLIEFHPLAIARVFDDLQSARPLARHVFRDLHFPIVHRLALDEHSQQTQTWFHEQLLRVAMNAAETAQRPFHEVPGAPTSLEPESRSYCPRCQEQYRIGAGSCVQCGCDLISLGKMQDTAATG